MENRFIRTYEGEIINLAHVRRFYLGSHRFYRKLPDEMSSRDITMDCIRVGIASDNESDKILALFLTREDAKKALSDVWLNIANDGEIDALEPQHCLSNGNSYANIEKIVADIQAVPKEERD